MESQGSASAPRKTELAPLPEFFSRSWRLFKSRWTLVITVGALGAAASLAGVAIPTLCAVLLWGLLPGLILGGIAALIAITAVLWFSSWAPIAMMEAMLDDSDKAPELGACLKKSWGKIIPFSWVYILFFVLIISGFCLFVIPGIYLAAALSMAVFTCVAEDDSGMAALEKSFYYVRGRWWQTLGRLFLIGAVGFTPSLIPILGWIISALLSPLPLAMGTELYKDLRASRQALGPVFVPSLKTRLLLASALLGLLLPLASAAALYKMILTSPMNFEAQWQSMLAQDPAMLNAAQGWFPTLQRLSGGATPATSNAVPTNP